MDELPEVACTLLARHAGSLEELGILLALIESGERWWDVGSMAARTGVSRLRARRVLEAFASANLLAIRISDDVRYQLRPGTPALEESIDALANAYRRSPTTVFSWVTGYSRRSLADFADAFRFTKNGRPKR